jgi:hypothetical protein
MNIYNSLLADFERKLGKGVEINWTKWEELFLALSGVEYLLEMESGEGEKATKS